MRPYSLTIVGIILANAGQGRRRFGGPAALGILFNRKGK